MLTAFEDQCISFWSTLFTEEGGLSFKLEVTLSSTPEQSRKGYSMTQLDSALEKYKKSVLVK